MKNSDFATDLILEILVFLVWREDRFDFGNSSFSCVEGGPLQKERNVGEGVGFSTSPEWQPWNYLNSYKRTQN